MFRCILPRWKEEIGHGYRTVHLLGKGASGNVWLAKAHDAKDCFAVKTSQTMCPLWQARMNQRECETLCQIGWGTHPNLIKPYEVRLTASNVQLVLQHCSGGTLEDYCRHHQVTEDLACYFLHQLVSALEYLHTSRIAYRDMKLGNVLLSSKPAVGQPPRLVLCDLGTAKSWKRGAATRCETFVGTPGFMSPQVLSSMFNSITACSSHATECDVDASQPSSISRSSYTYDACKADIWSVGALLHYMLHKQLPYGYDSFAPLLPPAEALMTLYQLEHERTWKDALGIHGLKHISTEAQDLLDQLLHPDEKERISIKQIKEHPWYNRPLPTAYTKALEQMQAEQQPLDALAKQLGEQCKNLALQAVDKLYQLSRSPAVLRRLQEEDHCITVPLQGSACRYDTSNISPWYSFSSTSPCSRSVTLSSMQGLRRKLLNVNALLTVEAKAAGLQLDGTDISSCSMPPVSIKDPQQRRVSCPVVEAETDVKAESNGVAVIGKVQGDDTCYMVQVTSCSA